MSFFAHSLRTATLLSAALLFLVSFPSFSQEPQVAEESLSGTWGIHWLSAHSQGGYESVTPGLYYRSPPQKTTEGSSVEGSWQVGAYRNSFGEATAYVGINADYPVSKNVKLGLFTGMSYGYRERFVDGSYEGCPRFADPKSPAFSKCFKKPGPRTFYPLLAPSVLVHENTQEQVGIRIGILPSKNPAATVAFEKKF